MPELLALDATAWVTIVLVVLISGWVHGALGLGFPLLATPALAAMMDVRSAILVTLLPTMAVNIASIIRRPGGVDSVRRHFSLLAFVLLGSVAGATALALLDPAPFRLLLAALILFYLWGKLRVSKDRLESNPLTYMALFGTAAGMAAGTTNAMVTVLIIYFLSLETPRAVMVPAMNACFFVGKVSQFTVLALAGFVSGSLLAVTAPLALAAVAALLVGQRAQARIEARVYQRLLRVLLLLLALTLGYQFFSG